MNKKILFFDIDGTLITEDTDRIPESTIASIREARSKGHLAFVNTGRTYAMIEPNIREIGFDGYVCGCGTYIRIKEEVLLYKTLDSFTCAKIIQLLRHCKIEAVLEGREDAYFDVDANLSEHLLKTKDNFARRGLGLAKNWDTKGLTFDKFFCEANEYSDIKTFKEHISKEFDVIDRGNDHFENVPKGYSKATGIEYLLNYYQLPLENAYAFGDSSNDLPMFEYVPNSIAMGGSDSCILDIATYITKDIHEDGIAHALKHLEII